MIVKEDLIPWFKNLKSYRRIDIMCSLLNLCLPFELRFLGTCLEDLGRRDAQNLRGAELRVNNPQEFVTDVSSLLAGQPTETKTRRQMALYLALLRVCNRTGVNELFKILDRWGDLDFSKFEGDPLQELLLVYAMAHNHPVFGFDQRQKCGEIYKKIIQGKGSQQSPVTTSPVSTPLASYHHQQVQTTSSPPPQTQQFTTIAFTQPPPMINTQNQQIPNVMMYPQSTMAQIIPTSEQGLPLNVVEMPSQMIPPMMPIQYRYQPMFMPMDNQFPPQANSPHLSQPTSPTHSRTGSPSRHVQVNQVQSQSNHRSNRHRARPTTESTPPPPLQQQQSQPQGQGSGPLYMTNDIMKNYEDINVEGAISQLQSLHLRNGYNSRASTIPRQHKHHHHHHHQQHHQHAVQQIHHPQNPIGWTTMQHPPPNYTTMPMVEMKKSSSVNTQSESGGSSNGEASPPPESTGVTVVATIPGLHSNQSQTNLRHKQMNSRLNGGNVVVSNNNNNLDFNGTQTIAASNSSGNLQMMITPNTALIANPLFQTAPPTQIAYRPNIPTISQSAQQSQIRQQFQTQPNGDMIIQFQPFLPTQSSIVVNATVPQRASPSTNHVPTPFPTNKIIQSCFNCGSTSHTGLSCTESSMEDVTRNSVYKLDYTNTAPPTQNVSMINLPTTAMTSSMSSTSSSLNSQPAQLSNNTENDQSITIIDLTQDTSSNSSSSSTSSIHGAK